MTTPHEAEASIVRKAMDAFKASNGLPMKMRIKSGLLMARRAARKIRAESGYVEQKQTEHNGTAADGARAAIKRAVTKNGLNPGAPRPREVVRQLNEFAMSEDVVFITGVPRSGTTRFYDVVTQAPEFHRARGSYIETHVLGKIGQFHDYRNVKPMYRFLGTPGLKENGLDTAIASLKHMVGIKKQQYYVRAFFYWTKRYAQMSRIVEKTPLHCRSMDYLKFCLPRAKFFFMYRHPLNVYASMRRRLKKEIELGRDPAGWQWMQKDAEQFAIFYGDIVTDALTYADLMPGDVFLLNYERFTDDPAATVKDAFDFIGVRFDPNYLEPAHEPGNPVDGLLYQPIKNYERPWQEHVTREEADEVQERLGEETLARLGLERI